MLYARDVREQKRLDSWDSLRHIFLQPSSAQSIVLPPAAHSETDELKDSSASLDFQSTEASSNLSASLCSLHLIAPYVGVFTQLRTLRLSRAAADREAVESLSAHMSNTVTSLSLKRCGLLPDDMQGVLALLAQGRQELEELDLSGNPIGNGGASLLAVGTDTQKNLLIRYVVNILGY